MRARFIGDRDGDGPKKMDFFGHVFIKGEFRAVPDEIQGRVEANYHFEIEPAIEAFNGAPLEAFDHDGNGEPGGSLPAKPKRGRPRKQ